MKAKNECHDCRMCESRDASVFHNLEAPAIEELTSLIVQNKYKENQIVFCEGNFPLGVYCIQKGKIKLYKTDINGKVHIFSILKKGDLLGQSSLFSDRELNYTAEAMEDAEVCFLEKNKFHRLLKSQPSVVLEILGRMVNDLESSQEKAINLAYRSVRVRFAELLLTLNKSFGQKSKEHILLDVQLSREEMAQAMGTTEETTVRLLTEFKNEGLVEMEGKKICIKDLPKVEAMTNAEY